MRPSYVKTPRSPSAAASTARAHATVFGVGPVRRADHVDLARVDAGGRREPGCRGIRRLDRPGRFVSSMSRCTASIAALPRAPAASSTARRARAARRRGSGRWACGWTCRRAIATRSSAPHISATDVGERGDARRRCATPFAVSHSAIDLEARDRAARCRFADSALATMIVPVVGLRERREVGGEVVGVRRVHAHDDARRVELGLDERAARGRPCAPARRRPPGRGSRRPRARAPSRTARAGRRGRTAARGRGRTARCTVALRGRAGRHHMSAIARRASATTSPSWLRPVCRMRHDPLPRARRRQPLLDDLGLGVQRVAVEQRRAGTRCR